MLEIEVANRSGAPVDAAGAETLARDVLTAEGVEAGELGIAFVSALAGDTYQVHVMDAGGGPARYARTFWYLPAISRFATSCTKPRANFSFPA